MRRRAFCNFTSRASLPLLYDYYPSSRHSFTLTETKLHMLLRAFDFPSLLTQEHGHVTHFVFLSARASLILAMPHVTLSSQILAIILVKLEGTNLTHIAFCLCRCWCCEGENNGRRCWCSAPPERSKPGVTSLSEGKDLTEVVAAVIPHNTILSINWADLSKTDIDNY